ncbi:riboflavin synthase [Celerinatantimonas yamalensis]|uniref:Riboflavin synthase n=1 Tax=Celerinatantimonas yamalensis TaxID=559956 RepID=A0ABW9GAH8_9GAMM
MFTGIVEALGRVQSIKRCGPDVQLTLQTGQLSMADVQLGDSIAVNGVCLTVVEFSADFFRADVSYETLSRSSLGKLKIGAWVNLEKAMVANGRFGGHMVSGHVDGLAQITQMQRQGQAVDVWLKYPADLARYIAEKGSLTVDGISLTVNQLQDDQLRVTIIPHTSAQTTMNEWQVGRVVNIEVDVVARYLERLVMPEKTDRSTSGLTHDKLAEFGFLSVSRG